MPNNKGSNCRLSEFATKDNDDKATKRENISESDGYRNEFFRDYTRIIHSTAFRRLRHKTQVFVHPKNDHVCTRLEHSLYVASISRTICRALRLNEDLAEAIAIGHDLGHAPFGHEGEKELNDIAKENELDGFSHEHHGLRVVDEIESPYPTHSGLNLTFAVRDGIICHCGEASDQQLVPDKNKTTASIKEIKPGEKPRPIPATLEGCVVRYADKIAYLGRDLEDALALKIISRKDILPIIKNTLGISNREIIDTLIRDIISNSEGEEYIGYSDHIFDAVNKLYAFNYEKIYKSSINKKYYKHIDSALKLAFEKIFYLTGLRKTCEADYKKELGNENGDLDWIYEVLNSFLTDGVKDFKKESTARLTLDFIAGMTDSFFIKTFEELFLPRSSV